MDFPKDLKYSENHSWVKVDGDTGTVGITDYAQEQLSEVVFIELPEVGNVVDKEDAVAELESSKSVSAVHTPVSGEIIDINESLSDSPEIINKSPYKDGWIFKIKLSSMPEINKLMTHEQYLKFIEE